jgi:hypothetical protein
MTLDPELAAKAKSIVALAFRNGLSLAKTPSAWN